MSRLQMALHAMPPGSFVDRLMEQSNKEINAMLDREREQEILLAKRLQRETGGSWSDALKAVIQGKAAA